MTDLYLRADTEAAALAALAGTPLCTNGRWIESGSGFALVVLGPLISTPAAWAPDGETLVSAATWDARFHLNVRLQYAGHPLEQMLSAAGLCTDVRNPRVRWA